MNILEEFKIKDKKYICMQKVIIDSEIICICKDLASNKRNYFKLNSKGDLEEINNENIENKIDKLIYAKSNDVIY